MSPEMLGWCACDEHVGLLAKQRLEESDAMLADTQHPILALPFGESDWLTAFTRRAPARWV